MCTFAMDFEFILKVAEKRIKAALGKAEAGKIYFTSATASCSEEAAGCSHGPGLVPLCVFLQLLKQFTHKNVAFFLVIKEKSFK